MFFPRLLLLDASFGPVSLTGSAAARFVPAGPVEGDHYEVGCSIAPRDRARYLIILTTDTDLESVLELSNGVSFTRALGGSDAAPSDSTPQQELGAGRGGSASPTDLPASASDTRAVTTTLDGATIAHDFAPIGRLTISVSH